MVLELLGPSIIGVLAAMASLGIRATLSGESIHDVRTFVQAFFGAEIFALGYSGIQSICYMLLMEFAFKKGLRVRSISSVILSTVLGTLAGASFVVYGNGNMKAVEILHWSAIGAIVGLIISCILCFFSRQNS